MVNHIKNLIRIKKFKPYYELYDVEDNKVSSFISSCNDASLLPNDLKQIRVILSSILSVEGSRPMNLKKLSQTQKSQFFFSHSIISDESDLIFSEPIVSNNQLKQLWLGKKDYQEKIFPLIERYKNKIESVISEKSSFEINKNIQFQDIESPSKIIKSDQLVDFPITYYSMKDIPSLIKIEKDYFIKIISFIFLFFAISNFLVFYLSSNPLYNLKINYFFDNLGISKIQNPKEIIQLEKKLTSQISSPIPRVIVKINTLLEELPENIFIHLINFEYTKNKLQLTFENPVPEEVINYLQNINNQRTKINNNQDYLKITYFLEEF